MGSRNDERNCCPPTELQMDRLSLPHFPCSARQRCCFPDALSHLSALRFLRRHRNHESWSSGDSFDGDVVSLFCLPYSRVAVRKFSLEPQSAIAHLFQLKRSHLTNGSISSSGDNVTDKTGFCESHHVCA